MRRFKVFALMIAAAAVGCGGSSSPAAPSTTTTTTTTTAALSLIGVTPAPLVGAAAQTITIIGTGFQTGLSLSIITPKPPNSIDQSFSGAAITALTSTSFQVSAMLSLNGSYTFQITSATGEKSNTIAVTPQFRSSGTTWIPEGIRLRTSDFGGPIADTSTIRLTDGRWRMFVSAPGGLIRSAISNDGLSFSVEPGNRIAGGGPRLVRIDDGRMRMFYGNGSTITSAISSDEGVTWTAEGVRLTAASAGYPAITQPGVVRLGGVWRMYFSDGSQLGTGISAIKSASSTDMLNWTVDAGIRIGPGSTLAGGGTHPAAFVNSDGSVSLFFGRLFFGQSAFYMYTARSTDGLNFTTETLIDSLGKSNDPDIVQVGSGLRMYYNWGDNNSGFIYSALSASGQPQSFVRR